MKVGIVGIGHGKFGNRSDATVQELAFEPFKLAIEDAKLELSPISNDHFSDPGVCAAA